MVVAHVSTVRIFSSELIHLLVELSNNVLSNHGLGICSMAGAGGCYHLKWAVVNFQILGRLIAVDGSGHLPLPLQDPHFKAQPGHAMLPDGTKV